MATNSLNNGSPIGLDVGTSRVVTAHRQEEEYKFQTQLNAFVTLPYSKMTESVLKREKHVLYSVRGSEIVVYGSESERFADLLSVETRRPMTKGILNSSEPESLALIQRIIDSLIGPAKRKGQLLAFSVPAPPLGSEEAYTYHEATLRQMLEEHGYDVRAINEGLAVVYGELEETNYTGIGVSCGGGLCNVCLAYLSVPVLSFSIAKGGDYIDSSAAAATGELANRVRIVKEESFSFDAVHNDKITQAIGVYYEDMIHSLVAGLKDALLRTRSLPRLGRSIPLVLSGGSVLPAGFRDRFEKALLKADFPITVSEVRLAADPLDSTAKGALISALSE